eukprot:gene7368-8582_t
MEEKIEGQAVHNLSVSQTTPEDSRPIVKRDIAELSPKVAFVLENVLSPSECTKLIEDGEGMGFSKLAHYVQKYRGNTRILVKSYSLSELVFNRIKQYLPTNVDMAQKSSPLPMSKHLTALYGIWDCSGVNELWRLCKYNPGGAFSAHFDGYYTRDTDNRSLLTFMIYLSTSDTVNEGGSTRFLERGTDQVLASVAPVAGSVLVFQHDMWHDGQEVLGGLKYIIRSDVMYTRRTENTSDHTNERQARSLALEAAELENSDPQGAVALYKKAFKMFPALEHEF